MFLVAFVNEERTIFNAISGVEWRQEANTRKNKENI
jgi:hypothetical protein